MRQLFVEASLGNGWVEFIDACIIDRQQGVLFSFKNSRVGYGLLAYSRGDKRFLFCERSGSTLLWVKLRFGGKGCAGGSRLQSRVTVRKAGSRYSISLSSEANTGRMDWVLD